MPDAIVASAAGVEITTPVGLDTVAADVREAKAMLLAVVGLAAVELLVTMLILILVAI